MLDWQKAGFDRADFNTAHIRAFLDECDRPQDRIRVVHIAGSKGKGTTAVMLASLLTSGGEKIGCRVGVFSSPYFFDEREMITVNGLFIPRADLDRLLSDARNLTYFEAMTAAAFRYFDEQRVDFAIIECGLGGARDATNVCKKPILTILTRIEKEHTDYFGNRIEDIVAEKCGILREGVPTICFDSGRYVNAKIRKCANRASAPIAGFFDSNEHVSGAAFDSIRVAQRSDRDHGRLLCRFAPRNNIDCVPRNDSVLPGRFEIFKRGRITFVFDVAHTPASATYLRARLDEHSPGKSIVFLTAFLKDKNVKKIISALVTPGDGAIVTEISHPRALAVRRLPRLAAACLPMKNPRYALEKAIRIAGKKDRVVCVTGSFETVKFALPLIKRMFSAT